MYYYSDDPVWLSGVKFDQGRVGEEFEYWSEFNFMEPSEIQGKWDLNSVLSEVLPHHQ